MITIQIKAESLNFYWAELGWSFSEGAPVRCTWEDLYYKILRDGQVIREGCTTVESKMYFVFEIEQLNGEIGQKMELKFPGYVEEELNSTNYGLPYKDIPNQNERLWFFSYSDDNPGDKDFYQIEDMVDLPKDSRGVNPSYISGFEPQPWINKSVSAEWMKAYVQKFFGINEEMQVVWIEDKDVEYLRKELDETIAETKEWEENKKNGITPSIQMLPQPLGFMIGKERVDELVSRGLKYAQVLEDSDGFIFHFEDGHTELSDTQIDLSDHFGDDIGNE